MRKTAPPLLVYSVRGGDSEVCIPLEKFTASADSFGDTDEVFSSMVASSFSLLDMPGCSLSNLYTLLKMKSLEHLDLGLSRVPDDASARYIHLRDKLFQTEGVRCKYRNEAKISKPQEYWSNL